MSVDSQDPISAQKGTPVEPVQGTPPEPVSDTPQGHQGEPTPAPDVDKPAGETPTFFDRNEWEEHLKTAPDDSRDFLRSLEKQLQGSYTKKMQGLSGDKQKVDAYNAFMAEAERDPVAAVNALMQQLRVDPQQFQPKQNGGDRWQEGFDTWPDARDALTEHIISQVQNQLSPILGRVQDLTTQRIENQLSEIDPDWREYEDQMTATLKTHPTLASEPEKLYRLSVPDEVIRKRAKQEILKQMDRETKASKVATGGNVPSSRAGVDTDATKPPPGVTAFDWAVQKAKKIVAGGG